MPKKNKFPVKTRLKRLSVGAKAIRQQTKNLRVKSGAR
jgi:hypothetical protein